MQTGILVAMLTGLVLAGRPVPTAGQHASRWPLHLAVGRDAFGGPPLDSVTVPSVSVEVAPAPRLTVELA